MGCGCGKSKSALDNAPKAFVHVAPDGKRTTFRSEVEAKAMKIRKGGEVQAKK